MEGDKGRPGGKARELFVSVLTEDGPTPSPSTRSRANAEEAFQARLLGKRITLANLDRPRPAAAQGSIAARQIQRRNQRLTKRHAGVAKDTQDRRSDNDPVTKPLSRRQRKARGLEEVDASLSYELLVPAHRLWTQYVHQLLGLVELNGEPSKLTENLLASVEAPNGAADPSTSRRTTGVSGTTQPALQNAIVKADFVGASLAVERAVNPALIGIEGMVAKETEGTFVIVTQTRQSSKRNPSSVKIVPKQNTDFTLSIAFPPSAVSGRRPAPLLQFTLFGNQLRNTLPTRATKKFKARKTIELGV